MSLLSLKYWKKFYRTLENWPDERAEQRTARAQFKNDIKNPKVLSGKILATLNAQKEKVNSLSEVEFCVFSQWGDDGIIQYLISKIDIPHKTFIEFGVENYTESNTRFLLINNNWSGLVIDGGKENISYIENDTVSWGYELHAKHSFITKDNIKSLIKEFLDNGYSEEVGILSVDIDGNDYYVWKEIDNIRPIIVITEYNSLLGYEKPLTIPYQEDFQRYHADPRLQYYGMSLRCAYDLAKEKGYSFVGCNSNGNNAYFVRNDKVQNLKVLEPKEGFVLSKFREFKVDGKRVSGKKRLSALEGKTFYNTSTGQNEAFKPEQ